MINDKKNNKVKSISSTILICSVLAIAATSAYAARKVCKTTTYCAGGVCHDVESCYTVPDL